MPTTSTGCAEVSASRSNAACASTSAASGAAGSRSAGVARPSSAGWAAGSATGSSSASGAGSPAGAGSRPNASAETATGASDVAGSTVTGSGVAGSGASSAGPGWAVSSAGGSAAWAAGGRATADRSVPIWVRISSISASRRRTSWRSSLRSPSTCERWASTDWRTPSSFWDRSWRWVSPWSRCSESALAIWSPMALSSVATGAAAASGARSMVSRKRARRK